MSEIEKICRNCKHWDSKDDSKCGKCSKLSLFYDPLGKKSILLSIKSSDGLGIYTTPMFYCNYYEPQQNKGDKL